MFFFSILFEIKLWLQRHRCIVGVSVDILWKHIVYVFVSMIDSIPSGTWGGCARPSKLWHFQGWWASLWQVHTWCLNHSRYSCRIYIKYAFSFSRRLQLQRRWAAATVFTSRRLETPRWWSSSTVSHFERLVMFKARIGVCQVEVQHTPWSWLLPTEKEEGAISTLVLRGSTDNLMDDIERAVDDGVNSFKVLVRVSHQKKSLSVLMGKIRTWDILELQQVLDQLWKK